MTANIYKNMLAREITNHDSQQHLTEEEKAQLCELLLNFEDLLEGKPGKWTRPQGGFKLNPKSKPYHARAYKIPTAYYNLMKEEIKRLESVGVSSLITESKWVAPTFGRKKKIKGVRICPDFKTLNTAIQHIPWPIPTLRKLLNFCYGMMYAMAIDLPMRY